MPAAFVQSIGFQGDGVNSVVATLNDVAAGNMLAVQAAAYQNASVPNATPTDDRGNTWNATTAPTPVGNSVNAFICYAQNVAAGNTQVTVDYGSSFYVTGELSEFSGVETSAALDQQTSSSAGGTTPTTGTTAALSQADELVLAVLAVDNGAVDAGIDVPATTGYTNLFVEQNGSLHLQGAGDYKIVSATAGQSAAWGTLAVSPSWAAKIATFKAAAPINAEVAWLVA